MRQSRARSCGEKKEKTPPVGRPVGKAKNPPDRLYAARRVNMRRIWMKIAFLLLFLLLLLLLLPDEWHASFCP